MEVWEGLLVLVLISLLVTPLVVGAIGGHPSLNASARVLACYTTSPVVLRRK